MPYAQTNDSQKYTAKLDANDNEEGEGAEQGHVGNSGQS